MDIYIPLTIILLLFCWLCRKHPAWSVYSFIFAVIVIMGMMVFRFEFGPDYFSYHDLYDAVWGIKGFYPVESVNDRTEPLFLHLLAFFSKFTYFIAALTIGWFLAVGVFLKRQVPSPYLWFALLLLFYDINCVLNNLVAMRTTTVGIIFIGAFYCLMNGRRWWYVGLILFASLIHTSAIVLVLLVFLNNDAKSIFFTKPFLIFIVILGLISFFVGRKLLLTYVGSFMIDINEDFQRYQYYIDNMDMSADRNFFSVVKSFVLFVLYFIPIWFISKYAPREAGSKFIIAHKTALTLAIALFILGNSLLSRYAMILNPVYIVSLTRLFKFAPRYQVNMVCLMLGFASVYSFAMYLQADFCESFLEYKSIFGTFRIP